MGKLVPLSFLCLWPAAALAGGVTSQYTKFDVKHCKVLDAAKPSEEWGGSWLCKGLGGLKVYFAEGDLRDMMAYGKAPQKHCAATQTFGAFNSAEPTIEWRLEGGKPFAAIQRWTVSLPDNSEKTASWLAVTRIEDGNSCRVATVEGAMPNANELARQAADASRGFDCAKDVAKVVSREPAEERGVTTGSPCEAE